jgi:hypothetical protein
MAQITKEDQINFSILTGFSIPLNNKEVIVEETSEYEYRFGEKNIKTPHHPPIIYSSFPLSYTPYNMGC